MKIKYKLLFYTVFLSILTSCTSLSDAQKVLRNEKKTTDEFMVKKGSLYQPHLILRSFRYLIAKLKMIKVELMINLV